MPKKRYTDEQIAFALRQAEAGATIGEICRKMGVAEATFYRWKRVRHRSLEPFRVFADLDHSGNTDFQSGGHLRCKGLN